MMPANSRVYLWKPDNDGKLTLCNCQGMAHSDAIDLATVFDKTGSINFFNIMSYLDISEP